MALIKLNNQSLSNITSAGLPSGTVLQVVSNSTTSSANITSTTWADISGLNVTITPSSASSKILCFAEVPFYKTSASYAAVGLRLLRDSTVTDTIWNGFAYGGTGDEDSAFGSFHSLDSPSSTSAIIYKIQVQATYTVGTVQINNVFNGATGRSRITVMEIAG